MKIEERDRITLTSINRRLNKGSSGEGTMAEYNQVVYNFYEDNKKYLDPREVISKSIHDEEQREKLISWYNKNQVDDKIPTLIMDEPDNSVSLRNILVLREELTEMVNKCSTQMQIIMVLHNPILLKHFIDDPRVNYIEITPGYIDLIESI